MMARNERRSGRQWWSWLAMAIAGLAVVVWLGAGGLRVAAAPVRRPKILGIAYVHMRLESAASAQRIFHQYFGFDRAFTLASAAGPVIYYKVNDYQYLEITPHWDGGAQKRFMTLAFRTNDARGLRAYLAARGFAPTPVHRRADGNLGFALRDPEGHHIAFEQFLPASRTGRLRGKLLSPRRLSRWIIHAGFVVASVRQEDRLFRQALGFHRMWHGGMTAGVLDWVDRRTTNGPDWIEYMLRDGAHPSIRTRAIANHFSLGILHMHQAYRALLARGWKGQGKPQIGRDGKWQLNVYTLAGSRVEMMGPKPVRKPCCSPMLPGGW